MTHPTPPVSDETLEPCPHCGCSETPMQSGTGVKCSCGASMDVGQVEWATSAWNTRAPSREVLAMREENQVLREALTECAHWVEWCIHNHDAPDCSLEQAALSLARAALKASS